MMAEKMRQAGAETARGLEYQKTSTLFGMAQQRTAAANAARQQAKKDQMSAIGDIASAGSQIATAGMKIPKLPAGGVTPSYDLGGVTGDNFIDNSNDMFMEPAEGFAKTTYGGQTQIVPFEEIPR